MSRETDSSDEDVFTLTILPAPMPRHVTYAMEISARLRVALNEPPEHLRHLLSAAADQIEKLELALDNKPCPACHGSGALGRYSSHDVYDCPWCAVKGTVSSQVETAFQRVSKVTPGLFRPCAAWGNDKRVERPLPRKA